MAVGGLKSRRYFLLLLPWLSRAQAARWRGTWSATGAGQTLSGTWTATAGADADAAFGTWTLRDAAGRQIAAGSWSARKAERRWEGSWQAQVASGGVYSGDWTARLPVALPSRLTELFAYALTTAVSGTWKMGRRSGAWSIRAYPDR